jgi:protein tyrosine/serine phosphatase
VLKAILAVLLLARSGVESPRVVPARRLASVAGLENVAQVAPGIYRGSAPSAEGLDSIKRLGIRTVVNLRHYHGASEEQGCRERGIDYVRIGLESSDAPNDADVRRFLRVVTDPARQPVYVHCWRGKDRTGVMVAAFRMAVQGWTRDQALEEMDAFGFYSGWRDLRAYVEALAARTDAVWPPAPGTPR